MRVTPRVMQQEYALAPMTRREARQRVLEKWRAGYRDLAQARWPTVRFATPGIAYAIGVIESVGRP